MTSKQSLSDPNDKVLSLDSDFNQTSKPLASGLRTTANFDSWLARIFKTVIGLKGKLCISILVLHRFKFNFTLGRNSQWLKSNIKWTNFSSESPRCRDPMVCPKNPPTTSQTLMVLMVQGTMGYPVVDLR
jgi:hypothetical protein